ncbi:hypothetical protein Q8A67_019432 [Cirrhinus molitorella]|uniref:Uncharacterized protein n=1 Tax=Cirrhinus molitorella TaxID=172907 RepID=A0AA88PLK9_9TELE|nr:hypothetical protein Q8A67_019432 [Cirrhinus molitorella]
MSIISTMCAGVDSGGRAGVDSDMAAILAGDSGKAAILELRRIWEAQEDLEPRERKKQWAISAQLSKDGPRESLLTYIEWACPTPDPVPSPPSSRGAEPQPKPTADGEPKPQATNVTSRERVTELRITSEPETGQSD